MVRQWSALLAETRVLIKGLALSPAPTNISSYLIAAGAVPPDMVKTPTELTTPFGTGVHVQAYMMMGFGGQQIGGVISIIAQGIPQGVCARLLTAKAGQDGAWNANGNFDHSGGATTVVSSGLVMGGAGPDTSAQPGVKGFAMNPTQAGWMCKYGGEFYETKTSEPTSPPISGTVKVGMIFFVDG